MRALTLHNPWAILLAADVKHVETRSWKTEYRGPLAIHAAKQTHKQMSFCISEEYWRLLRRQGFRVASDLPFGAIVGVRTLIGVFPMTKRVMQVLAPERSLERRLGGWEEGRYAWVFRRPALDDNYRNLIHTPIVIPGKRGLWEWDDAGALDREEESDPFNGESVLSSWDIRG